MRIMPWSVLLKSMVADIPLEEIVDEVRDFDHRFKLILRKHTSIYTIWSLLSILGGIIGMFLLEGKWWYFSTMNLAWGAINYLLVLHLYNHTFFLRFMKGNVFDRFEVHWHVENMLWLNIGLDTAYIFAGLFLWALGINPAIGDSPMWLGFGISVIIQGAFLFGMDNIVRILHRRNLRKCQPFLEGKLSRLEAKMPDSVPQ